MYKVGDILTDNGYQVVAVTVCHVLAVSEKDYATWCVDEKGHTCSGHYGLSYRSGMYDLAQRATSAPD